MRKEFKGRKSNEFQASQAWRIDVGVSIHNITHSWQQQHAWYGESAIGHITASYAPNSSAGLTYLDMVCGFPCHLFLFPQFFFVLLIWNGVTYQPHHSQQGVMLPTIHALRVPGICNVGAWSQSGEWGLGTGVGLGLGNSRVTFRLYRYSMAS